MPHGFDMSPPFFVGSKIFGTLMCSLKSLVLHMIDLHGSEVFEEYFSSTSSYKTLNPQKLESALYYRVLRILWESYCVRYRKISL